MKQRMLRLLDNYRPLAIAAALLFLSSAAFSQHSYTPTSSWGYQWSNGYFPNSLGIPSDTLAIEPAHQNEPHIAYKDSLLYLWSPSLHRWNTNGALRGGGSGGGSGVDVITKQNFGDTSTYDATRYWVLQQLSIYTPLSRFLDSLTVARITYLKAVDTAWMHQQLIKLQTNSASNSNLIFSDGLVWSSVDNHVRAQFSSPIWNANRIQSYPVSPVVCNGCVPYLDSANRIIRWMHPDSAALADFFANYHPKFYAGHGLIGSSSNVINIMDTVSVDPDIYLRLDALEGASGSLPTDYVTYPALDSALATISASAFWNPYDQSDTLTDFRQVSLNDYQLRIFSSLDPDMASEMFFNYSTHRTRMSAWNNYSGAYTRFEVDPAYTDLYSEGKDADSVLQFSRVALYGGLGIYWQSSDGKYFIENLPVYANDAAAGTAGLEADRVYKTPDGHLMIKLFLPFLLFIKRRRKKRTNNIKLNNDILYKY
jgi:hypothetical protein